MKQGHSHLGHRTRMRKRYFETGLDGFQPHEILEMLLYYAVPRADTNGIAHELLNTFGSISAVLDAPLDSLQEVKGIGESGALLIKLIPDICRLYYSEKSNVLSHRPSKNELEKMIIDKFIGKNTEVVLLTLLNAKTKVVFCDYINDGSMDTLLIDVKQIVKLALKYDARFAILAHNHPSGIALPSNADIESTKKLSEIFSSIEVKLIDHLIVAGNDYVSLADDGMEHLF